MPARISHQRGHKFEGTRITYLTDWGRNKRGNRKFLGVCECGTFVVKDLGPVRHKSVRSCGCILSETVIEINKQKATHSCTKKKGYSSYRHMVNRCYNEDDPDYYNYGKLGVKVCDRWLEPDGQGVVNFFSDMGEKPDGLSLDRKDVYGNYTPENCHWANVYHQAYNKKFRSTNKSGKTGVRQHEDGGYVAYIGHEGDKLYLGWFRKYEEAVDAREKAELKYRGELLGY